jgi:hypothetical protein
MGVSEVRDGSRGASPFEVLGVPEDAGEEEIRRAYLVKVKEFPPDRSPEAFERIRDAYEAAREPRMRAERLLKAVDPLAPLVELAADEEQPRHFVGVGPWMAVLKERKRG